MGKTITPERVGLLNLLHLLGLESCPYLFLSWKQNPFIADDSIYIWNKKK